MSIIAKNQYLRLLKSILKAKLILVSMLITHNSYAIEEITVTIKEHLFYPSEITIPERQKVKITFENKDNSSEEIDSFDLNREKVVFANSRASIFVGPLEKGRYRFFGEYHPTTAVGFVNVK